jgi:hypothetical protein
MAKSPKGKGKGAERPTSSGRAPYYDDRPGTRRGSGTPAGQNPSIPSYGDTEPGDPRRSHSEASSDLADDEMRAEDELDIPDDDTEEEEEI